MGWQYGRARVLAVAMIAAAAVAAAQTPRPRTPSGAQPPPGQPAPATPAPPATPGPPAAPQGPSEAQLGVKLYPNAVFLRSYDAGRGQQYHLFGVAAPFGDMVNFYRTLLKDRGNLVFEVPPTHVFEIGRFREETMAFPPSVTVKDYTFGGSAGYPNPTPGGRPERFPTVIQIVAAPAGTAPLGN
jgi:hypothetical protein